jgi:predicted component of type VI protein secretion system
MKTTVELPDAIYRQAKAEATLRGRKLKDLIEEGLRPVLDRQPGPATRPSLAELMQPARGVVESGIPDLATNPEHLNGLPHRIASSRVNDDAP